MNMLWVVFLQDVTTFLWVLQANKAYKQLQEQYSDNDEDACKALESNKQDGCTGSACRPHVTNSPDQIDLQGEPAFPSA